MLELLERPTKLIEMTDEQFAGFAEEFVERGAPLLKAIRRGAGIMAWAARHHFRDSHYGAWLHQFAQALGMHEDTVTRWRDQMTSELGLPLPMGTQARSTARRTGSSRGTSAPRPAAAAPQPAAAGRGPVRAAPPEPIELGAIGSQPVQQAVAYLLLTSAHTLAEAATTIQLRTLATLVEDALQHQNRESLRARARRSGLKTG